MRKTKSRFIRFATNLTGSCDQRANTSGRRLMLAPALIFGRRWERPARLVTLFQRFALRRGFNDTRYPPTRRKNAPWIPLPSIFLICRHPSFFERALRWARSGSWSIFVRNGSQSAAPCAGSTTRTTGSWLHRCACSRRRTNHSDRYQHRRRQIAETGSRLAQRGQRQSITHHRVHWPCLAFRHRTTARTPAGCI